MSCQVFLVRSRKVPEERAEKQDEGKLRGRAKPRGSRDADASMMREKRHRLAFRRRRRLRYPWRSLWNTHSRYSGPPRSPWPMWKLARRNISHNPYRTLPPRADGNGRMRAARARRPHDAPAARAWGDHQLASPAMWPGAAPETEANIDPLSNCKATGVSDMRIYYAPGWWPVGAGRNVCASKSCREFPVEGRVFLFLSSSSLKVFPCLSFLDLLSKFSCGTSFLLSYMEVFQSMEFSWDSSFFKRSPAAWVN
jgi:hypothetical protein